jgi:hypothetical protein
VIRLAVRGIFRYNSLSVKDGRDDRIDRERVVVLRIDDDHGPLGIPDQDELGIGTARKGALDVAQKVPCSLPRPVEEIGDGYRKGNVIAVSELR